MAKKSRFKKNWKSAVRRDSERQKEAGSSFGYLNLPSGIPLFNATPGGRIKFDIMPYVVTDKNHPDRYEEEGVAVEGELWYKRPINVHRNIGTSNDSYICPRTIGKRCPICEYRERRLKEGADWEEVKGLKPSLRNLYVIIPKRSKDHKEEPHIWDISQFLFQNLLNEELAEDEDNAIFPSLEEGKTLSVRFDSSVIGDSKPFAEASRIDFEVRKKGYSEEILESIPSLDDILKVLPYKSLEAKFMELEDEDLADADDDVEDVEDYDEEEEETPKRKKKSVESKPKRKPKPAPKEEEEDEEEEEEDEAPFDDEEEDDFEEEDDLEDEEEEDEDEDDLEDDFDDFEDDEEEEEEPPAKPIRKKTNKAPIKRKKK